MATTNCECLTFEEILNRGFDYCIITHFSVLHNSMRSDSIHKHKTGTVKMLSNSDFRDELIIGRAHESEPCIDTEDIITMMSDKLLYSIHEQDEFTSMTASVVSGADNEILFAEFNSVYDEDAVRYIADQHITYTFTKLK